MEIRQVGNACFDGRTAPELELSRQVVGDLFGFDDLRLSTRQDASQSDVVEDSPWSFSPSTRESIAVGDHREVEIAVLGGRCRTSLVVLAVDATVLESRDEAVPPPLFAFDAIALRRRAAGPASAQQSVGDRCSVGFDGPLGESPIDPKVGIFENERTILDIVLIVEVNQPSLAVAIRGPTREPCVRSMLMPTPDGLGPFRCQPLASELMCRWYLSTCRSVSSGMTTKGNFMRRAVTRRTDWGRDHTRRAPRDRLARGTP